jgi:hypothetical protein
MYLTLLITSGHREPISNLEKTWLEIYEPNKPRYPATQLHLPVAKEKNKAKTENINNKKTIGYPQ